MGDSTRFLQEDLDALVEISPIEKDTGRVTQYCPSCHHDELVDGRVQGTSRVCFRPQKTRFWTYRSSNIDTFARMCGRCGMTSWFSDTKTLDSLREEGEEGEEGEKGKLEDV